MKLSWTDGLDETQKKDVRGDFKSSLIVRKRLAKMLEDKINSNIVASYDKDDYNTANWAFKMADSVGYRRAMKEVINLILEDE
jgi:hypothetical protein